MNPLPFFMVWMDGGRGPSQKHDTYDSACAEAKRLAQKNPREAFVVLQSLGHYTVAEPPVEFHSHPICKDTL